MIITTHLVLPYPQLLPNWETLLNQVTVSKHLNIQDKLFPPPFSGLNKPGQKSFKIQRSSLGIIQKLLSTTGLVGLISHGILQRVVFFFFSNIFVATYFEWANKITLI